MKKIEKDKWYSVKEITENEFIPFFKSRHTLTKWIKIGRVKAVGVGTGNGKRYKIRGQWLIEFIAKFESGDFK